MEAGVQRLALTDHDTVDGYLTLASSELPEGVELIAGVEWTCLHIKQVVHVVGLGFDAHHPMISAHVELLVRLREERAERIAVKLEKATGLTGLLAEAMALSGGQVGRPHFAQVLVDRGLVSDAGQAFKRYLGVGKVGDVKVEWPSLETVITLIQATGGVAVLAHPTKYRLTLTKVRALVAAFAELGGDAIEISYPGVTLDQQRSLGFLVDKYDLLVSAGSDFHTPANQWSAVGSFPVIPDDMPTIENGLINT